MPHRRPAQRDHPRQDRATLAAPRSPRRREHGRRGDRTRGNPPRPCCRIRGWDADDDGLHAGARTALDQLIHPGHTETYEQAPLDWRSFSAYSTLIGHPNLSVAALPCVLAVGGCGRVMADVAERLAPALLPVLALLVTLAAGTVATIGGPDNAAWVWGALAVTAANTGGSLVLARAVRRLDTAVAGSL